MYNIKHTLIACALFAAALAFAEPPAGKNWKLVFEDDFNYPNPQLDVEWIAQNGANGHILCSRWRENAVADNGTLKLIAKKESRGGQDWTAGSIWTKKLFKYGYFECRYKYAAATGTNNSFWLMTQGWQKVPEAQGLKRFEIDINEGHYPDEINTNLHNWSDFWVDAKSGKKMHHSWHKAVTLSPRAASVPDRTISLDVPVITRKIRLSSAMNEHFHFREIRVYPKNDLGYYPDIKSNAIPSEFRDLENYARKAKVVAHSPLHPEYGASSKPEAVIDGNVGTSWITAPSVERKFIEIDLGEDRMVGAVQFLTGWFSEEGYINSIRDYKLEYWDGKNWVVMSELADDFKVETDLSQDYHTYALEWNDQELIFYFDGREIRRMKNDICHWESPVWLSLAIANFAGAVADSVDGTFMEVDYVKVWQEEGKVNMRQKRDDEPNL